MEPTGNHGIAELWQQLRQHPVQAAPWRALAHQYAALSLPWQAGYAARQAHRLDAALLPQLQALSIGAWQDTAAGDAVLGQATLHGAAQLTHWFAQQVSSCPGDWLTWLYLARLLDMSPQGTPLPHATNDAVEALEQAALREPMAGETLHWLGVWRLNAGDAPGAVAALSGVLELRPVRYGSMMFLGEALLRVGNVPAAEKAFTRAALSNNPDFLLALANRVYAHNYWQEAIEVVKKALSLRADSVALWLALANIQSEVYALADCRASVRHILALAPEHPEARLLEAGLQGRMGDAKSHLAHLQRAYAVQGDPLSRLASSIAMTSLYHDALPGAEVADLHRRLCAPIEAALPQTTPFATPSRQMRRLRIGYVTGDLHRQHPVNIFMLPVLLRHDPAQFEICVYHTGTMHDNSTRQAQACAHRWLEAATLSDADLQRTIVADGVDILIDLAGHTASHRLGVFALRAAPVQATFLGYPHSTGLAAMDWLVGDAVVSPSEHAHLFSEGIAQLPNSVFCWAPMDSYPLPEPRPAQAPLVFGSFNNVMKLSPRTLALWCRLLHALPQSQLLLKAPALRDASVQERFTRLFAQHGIGPDRLVLRGPSALADMMQEYGDMDIALDPTPYNGGTTTLQALWMGVPVVTLTGSNFVGRMGTSFLATLGKPAWIAHTEDAYVQSAIALAQRIAALRGQRAQLRAHMAGSALCDITRYVQDFEALLQRMWSAHGVAQPGRLLGAS